MKQKNVDDLSTSAARLAEQLFGPNWKILLTLAAVGYVLHRRATRRRIKHIKAVLEAKHNAHAHECPHHGPHPRHHRPRPEFHLVGSR